MTKIELMEENNKLLKQVQELEKELSRSFDLNENRVLHEMNNLLRDQLFFYQELLRNLTFNKEVNNESN